MSNRLRKVKALQNTISTINGIADIRHEDGLGAYYSSPRLGTKEFIAAAVQLKSFSVAVGNYSYFLIRNEKRRGEWGWWYAYRKVEGKVYKAYVGKTESITVARLISIDTVLTTKARGEG